MKSNDRLVLELLLIIADSVDRNATYTKDLEIIGEQIDKVK